MLDTRLRCIVDPVLEHIARRLVSAGITADAVTIVGCVLGLLGALLIAWRMPLAGLAAFLGGRVLDGLDGTIARQSAPTDRGGFLDIVLDFVVYAAIPVAFAYADPNINALAAAVLLASFLANGAAFLAYALMAERNKIPAQSSENKSFQFLAGLAEGTETIIAFTLFCLFPLAFPTLALIFAGICVISAAARIMLGWRMLR
jgi:phosphatidylglycerophosphate synthase